jgi:hypothetical protein
MLLTKQNVSITTKPLRTQEDPYMEFATQLTVRAKLDVDALIKAEPDQIQRLLDRTIILRCHYTAPSPPVSSPSLPFPSLSFSSTALPSFSIFPATLETASCLQRTFRGKTLEQHSRRAWHSRFSNGHIARGE